MKNLPVKRKEEMAVSRKIEHPFERLHRRNPFQCLDTGLIIGRYQMNSRIVKLERI
jgi:hypothetical protein